MKPALDGGGRSLASLYEGMLAELLRPVLGGTLAARCLDMSEAIVSPWRFAVSDASRAAGLAPGEHEGGDAAAKRLGLLD